MSRSRTTFLGALLGGLVVLLCFAVAAGVQWYVEGAEIAICDAAKDFWDSNERAPRSLAELRDPGRSTATTRDGRAYTWACSDEGDVPVCSVNWMESGEQVGRSCGRLDTRSWVDWF